MSDHEEIEDGQSKASLKFTRFFFGAEDIRNEHVHNSMFRTGGEEDVLRQKPMTTS